MRPFRLLMFGLIGLLVYMAFFALPRPEEARPDFEPGVVAQHEIATWQAVRAGQEYGIYLNIMLYERELHGYTWFRAAQAAFYMGRATQDFVGIDRRYERVMPELEAAATIQRDWDKADFDPAQVARANLNWWVARKMKNLNNVGAVSGRIAEEYALRYGVADGRAMTAATMRAEALQARDMSSVDPDWTNITELLTSSYTALRTAMRDRRQRASGM